MRKDLHLDGIIFNYRQAAFLDLLSLTVIGDTVLILPSLNHALVEWSIVLTAFDEKFRTKDLYKSRTGIVLKNVHKALRLWVPYEPEPTMPLDFVQYRTGWHHWVDWR